MTKGQQHTKKEESVLFFRQYISHTKYRKTNISFCNTSYPQKQSNQMRQQGFQKATKRDFGQKGEESTSEKLLFFCWFFYGNRWGSTVGITINACRFLSNIYRQKC